MRYDSLPRQSALPPAPHPSTASAQRPGPLAVDPPDRAQRQLVRPWRRRRHPGRLSPARTAATACDRSTTPFVPEQVRTYETFLQPDGYDRSRHRRARRTTQGDVAQLRCVEQRPAMRR